MRFGNEENWVNGMNFFFLWKCFMNFYDTYRLSARVDFCWCWMSNCFPVCILMYGIELSFLLVLSFCRWKYLYLCLSAALALIHLCLSTCLSFHVSHPMSVVFHFCVVIFHQIHFFLKQIRNLWWMESLVPFPVHFKHSEINLISERNVLFVISQYWLNCYKEMYIECSFIINTILIVILPVELSSISLLP